MALSSVVVVFQQNKVILHRRALQRLSFAPHGILIVKVKLSVWSEPIMIWRKFVVA